MNRIEWYANVNRHKEAELLDRGRNPAAARAPLNIAIMNRQIEELYDKVSELCAAVAESAHLRGNVEQLQRAAIEATEGIRGLSARVESLATRVGVGVAQ